MQLLLCECHCLRQAKIHKAIFQVAKVAQCIAGIDDLCAPENLAMILLILSIKNYEKFSQN
jgi:hypothetical protein